MAEFCGKWELLSTDDNFEKYMEVTGVTPENRQLAQKTLCAKLLLTIARSGTTWTITMATQGGERSFEYTEGQSVNVVTLDGRKVQVVYTFEGGQLVETQTGDGFVSRNVRTVEGDTLKMTFNSGGVTSVRTYKKA